MPILTFSNTAQPGLWDAGGAGTFSFLFPEDSAAFKKIQNGESVTSVAFDSGYESLSGFTDSFKSVFGVSPSRSKDKQLINIIRIESPLGTMYSCAVDQGICLLEFTDRRMLETEFKSLAKLYC